MAENMQTLIAFRFLQGISSAGGVVIARAAAADLYEGPEMARFFAFMKSRHIASCELLLRMSQIDGSSLGISGN